MNSFIFLQDPADEDSTNLLEAVLGACESAIGGGAIFSYASRAGIAMLFKDDVFIKFAKRAPFDLVVGLDAITNEASLKQLKVEADRYPKLRVRAFLHNRRVNFHPKFIWFRTTDGGHSIVGSGNLTPGGLAANWEAFSILPLGLNAAATVATEWDDWKTLHEAELKMIADPAVLARASLNRFNIIKSPEAEEAPLAAPPPPTDGTDVLIAELPKAGDRWKQANFDLDTFRGYFHLDPTTSRRVLLWHVESNGALGAVEIRRSVSVRSHNFRIELEGNGNDQEYPTKGPPIAVFRRTGTRRFRYQLLMPGEPDYAKAEKILDDLWEGRADRMRRIQLSSTELKARWSASPLL